MGARFLTVVAGAAALATWAPAARSAPINLITNGSFEQGYAGWTPTTGAGAANPGNGPALIPTDGTTAGPFGDKVVSDNASSPYPNADKSGKQAAYFVDDVARETISQSITVATAGVYEVGFDLLTTTSGSKNQYDSSFAATAGGVTIVQANVSTFGVNTWTHFAANANLLGAGTYLFTFVFDGGAAPAKDIVVDNVYAIASSGPGVNVPLPEPASFAVLGTMLLGTGLLRRRIG